MEYIKERAEALGAEELSTLCRMEYAGWGDRERLTCYNPMLTGVVDKLDDYFSNSLNHPLFFYGPKGSGKTLGAMAALSKKVREDNEFIPAMFIYNKGNRKDMVLPEQLASEDVWQGRLEKIDWNDEKDIMDNCSAVVYDDLHYRCEASAEDRNEAERLADDLYSIVDVAKRGKKVLIVSEDPLAAYAEKLRMDRIDEILPEFGELPYWKYKKGEKNANDWRRLKDGLNPMSSFEMPLTGFSEWENLFSLYGVGADHPVKEVLFSMSSRPRSFVKFVNMFGDKERITIDGVAEKARTILKSKFRPSKTLDLYECLLSCPTISVNGYEYFDRDVTSNDIKEFKKNGTFRGTNLSILAKCFHDFKTKNPESGLKAAEVLRAAKNLEYYLGTSGNYSSELTLLKPFKEAFEDAIVEVPTMDIISNIVFS